MRSKFWRRVVKYGTIVIKVIADILKGVGKDKPKQLNK